ncbi:Thrombospondin type 3 repeat domain containing protein [Marine Group I thaumarchaeote SCGC RSA3]|uniref:Thrombospondin type 3 repeat domain containing protein n=3 Tax=Marine Group I TaxID=905826 RepID=A0A087RQB9_9ARCH|nr:Thrombospondin type 3 repeat domain containing protein [Marine Group I thaumarchaeote SCGC AAA799-D11]KFM16802.1 Thrombospondin type 3 repeat domain containing protein [Marine Group I thaumarchaeote SCGC RSA3]
MISRFFIIPVIIAIGLSVTVLFMNFEEIAETKLAGVDADKDKISDRVDNCPKIKNEDQDDFDQDAVGNPCDPDDDNDGIVDVLDVFDDNPEEWSDFDFDGIGSKEDPDDDNDGVIDSMDEAPVPVSEELVATYLENIQECAKMNDGTSRLLCYSKFFGKVAEDQENNSNALELSIALSKIGLIDDCHFVSHEVGHVAFKENPSVIENLIGMDGTMCRGGYFHGVLAAYFHDVQEDGDPFPSDYNTVCNDLIGTSNYQDCVHGLGHGMVHYFEEDLESSLQMCQDMSFYQDVLCTGGVMMQYTDNVLTRQGISKNVISNLCLQSELDIVDFVECNVSTGITLAFFTDHDFEEGSKLCELIENKQGQNYCLEGLRFEIQDSEKFKAEPLTLDKREKYQPQFVEGGSKVIDIQSPAIISNFQFEPKARLISFVIDRPQYVAMYIPNEFLSSKMIVAVNGQIPDELEVKGNVLGERVSMIRFVPDDSGLVMISPLS